MKKPHTQNLRHRAYLARFGREDGADTLALRSILVERAAPVLLTEYSPEHAALVADAGQRDSLILTSENLRIMENAEN